MSIWSLSLIKDNIFFHIDSKYSIRYFDSENKNDLTFLTNHFMPPAITITKLDKCRWQIELCFKWMKQHLRIKSFYGTSENAAKTQIWIAISIYVLVATDIHETKYNNRFCNRLYLFDQ